MRDWKPATVGLLLALAACSFERAYDDTDKYWSCGPDGGCEGGCVCLGGEVCVPPAGSELTADDCKVCPAGYRDCNGEPGDQCETRIDTHPEHCGECGHACGEDLCEYGTCVDRCGMFLDACGRSCVDLKSDPEHCGECDNACTPDEVCNDGRCSDACRRALTDCSGACVDIEHNDGHCGACGNACRVEHGRGDCFFSECDIDRCHLPWSDCDDVFENGCETNLVEDSLHCGGCYQSCADPVHAFCDGDDRVEVIGPGDCVSGICEYPDVVRATCAHGCDQGQCVNLCQSVVCDANEACEAGLCICPGEGGLECSDNESCCPDGCENLDTDENNCGDCGVACVADIPCDLGRCGDASVYCDGLPCDTADDQVCCFHNMSFTCVDAQECPGAAIECDGPEDCDAGQECCITLGAEGAVSSCQMSGQCIHATTCGSDADCTEETKPHCCTDVLDPFGGYPVHVCQPVPCD